MAPTLYIKLDPVVFLGNTLHVLVNLHMIVISVVSFYSSGHNGEDTSHWSGDTRDVQCRRYSTCTRKERRCLNKKRLFAAPQPSPSPFSLTASGSDTGLYKRVQKSMLGGRTLRETNM